MVKNEQYGQRVQLFSSVDHSVVVLFYFSVKIVLSLQKFAKLKYFIATVVKKLLSFSAHLKLSLEMVVQLLVYCKIKNNSPCALTASEALNITFVFRGNISRQ